jgi:pyruvate dehydrogenase kinase 2/3/4
MELSRLDTLRSASVATSRTPEMWFREVSSVPNDLERDAGAGTHTSMGIGLPLSNIFATCVFISSILTRTPLTRTIYRYFGGSLELVSLDGWGEHHYAQLE